MGKPVERFAIPESLTAFDPGESCGVACFRRGRLYASFVLKGTPPGDPGWQYRSLHSILMETTTESRVVVCEGYTGLPRGLDQHSQYTIRLIGWIHGLALCSNTPFFLQMPSVKKPYLSHAADAGRAYDLHVALNTDKHAPLKDHERDAVAHGMVWLARHTDWRPE